MSRNSIYQRYNLFTLVQLSTGKLNVFKSSIKKYWLHTNYLNPSFLIRDILNYTQMKWIELNFHHLSSNCDDTRSPFDCDVCYIKFKEKKKDKTLKWKILQLMKISLLCFHCVRHWSIDLQTFRLIQWKFVYLYTLQTDEYLLPSQLLQWTFNIKIWMMKTKNKFKKKKNI